MADNLIPVLIEYGILYKVFCVVADNASPNGTRADALEAACPKPSKIKTSLDGLHMLSTVLLETVSRLFLKDLVKMEQSHVTLLVFLNQFKSLMSIQFSIDSSSLLLGSTCHQSACSLFSSKLRVAEALSSTSSAMLTRNETQT